jgi:hypothetical protein
MSSFGALFTRTLREPLAWVGAIAVATVGAEQPADWIAHELGRSIGLHFRGPSLLEALAGYNAAPAFAGWLGMSALAWLCRLPLVAATLVARQQPRRTSALAFLLKNSVRVLRTRGIGIMVTSAFAVIPGWILLAWRKHAALSTLPDIGLALLLAVAGGWLTLGDRFAFARFDARQDAVSRQARDDARNAPYYLDTGKERAGYGVATGADNAVTDAGWALLDRRAFAIVGITVLMDLVRVAGVVFVPAPVPAIAVRIVVGTFAAIVSAVLWTRYFDQQK